MTAPRSVDVALLASTPPANEALWAEVERTGFEVILFDRNAFNRKKKADTSITTAVLSDSYELMVPSQDDVTLVAGDGDYVPTVQILRSRGSTCLWLLGPRGEEVEGGVHDIPASQRLSRPSSLRQIAPGGALR